MDLDRFAIPSLDNFANNRILNYSNYSPSCPCYCSSSSRTSATSPMLILTGGRVQPVRSSSSAVYFIVYFFLIIYSSGTSFSYVPWYAIQYTLMLNTCPSSLLNVRVQHIRFHVV